MLNRKGVQNSIVTADPGMASGHEMRRGPIYVGAVNLLRVAEPVVIDAAHQNKMIYAVYLRRKGDFNLC